MSAQPQVPVSLVQHPTDAQKARIIDVLLAGKAENRFYFALNQNNPDILRLDIEALVESALVDCEVWVAEAVDGKIGSVAIWIPFGKAIMGTPEKDKFFTKIKAARPADLNKWHGKVLDPVRARRNQNPKVNMSNGGYIALFSTHPAYRQQGLGSAVVNAVKQRADKVMVVTQNRELAEMFWAPLGFETVFEEQVALPDGRVEPYLALVYEAH